MEKIIIFILVIFLSFSCSKKSSDIEPIKPPLGEFEKLLIEYNLDENIISYEYATTGIDTSKIYFSGRLKSDFYLKGFDKESKKEYISINMLDVLDTIVTVNEGFGENHTYNLNAFYASHVNNPKQEYTQILLRGLVLGNQANNNYNQRWVSSNLYFLYNNEITFIESIVSDENTEYFSELVKWYEENIIVTITINREEKYYCYSPEGKMLFEAKKPIYPAFNLNIEEYISYKPDSNIFQRKNVKTNNIIWSVNMFPEFENQDLNNKYRIDESKLTIENTIIKCKINYTLLNGEKLEKNESYDIETGNLIE